MKDVFSLVCADLVQIWPWWLSSTLKAVVWLAAGALVDLALRKRAASLRHAGAVMFALGVPLIFVVNLSPRPEALGWRPLDPVWERLTTEEMDEDVRTGTVAVTELTSLQGHEAREAGADGSWKGAVVGLWMVGVVAGWIRIVWRMGPRSSAGRRVEPGRDGALVRLVSAACVRGGLSGTPPLRIEMSGVPRVVGLWRPTLVMPESFFGWSSEKQLAVVRHEVAHLSRRDLVWLAVTEAALALAWMVPLSAGLRRRVALACEQACDDEVLGSGIAPVRYAEHLASFLSVRSQPSVRWSVPAIRRRGWILRFERITAVDVERCRLPRGKFAGLVVAAATVAVAATAGIGCAGPNPNLQAVKVFAERYPEPLPTVRAEARALTIKLKAFELVTEDREAPALGFPEGYPKAGGQVLPPEVGWQVFHVRRQGVDSWAAPPASVRPGKPAGAESVRILRVPVEFSKAPSGAGYVPVAFEDFKIGIMLKVKAWPGSKPDRIRLNVDAEFKEFEGFRLADPAFPGIELPEFYSRRFGQGGGFQGGTYQDETIECLNGSYIIIGSRPDEQDVEDVFPLLGDVPLLGRLFRARQKQHFVRLAAVQVVVEEAHDSESGK